MAKIKYLAVHHSGGTLANPYFSSQSMTLAELERAHRARWPDFESSLGFYTGYNIVVFADGSWVQARKFGEETAAQKGHNFDTISICLMGNFSIDPKTGSAVDKPTDAQLRAYRKLAKAIYQKTFEVDEKKLSVVPGTEVDIPLQNVVPHRMLQLTECYGFLLPDHWARNLLIEDLQLSILEQILNLYIRIFDLMRASRRALIGIGVKLGMPLSSSCFEQNNRG